MTHGSASSSFADGFVDADAEADAKVNTATAEFDRDANDAFAFPITSGSADNSAGDESESNALSAAQAVTDTRDTGAAVSAAAPVTSSSAAS
jgi:hypothetical protein